MENIKDIKKSSTLIDLKENFKENMQDKTFKELVTNLNIPDKIAILNSSAIMDSATELKNCANCRGLYECQNKVRGYYLYPRVTNNIIELGYTPCHYFKEQERLLNNRLTADKELKEARFKDIDIKDKKRVKVIKWLKDFYDNYDGIKNMKGLFLHGTFGGGKTYLIYALLNELQISKHVSYEALYFPEILKSLKEDWDSYNSKLNYYANIPILLIDDIGAETVSEWSRDEVLGTILQNRMNNRLTTFFTSNLTIEELEIHLSQTKTSLDKVKARRIIERIKNLTIDIELITEDRRK